MKLLVRVALWGVAAVVALFAGRAVYDMVDVRGAWHGVSAD